MKGFLQEYGIIMVVVAIVLGMLAFGKTGYAKSIQDAILGSADHIVETGENITKKEVNVKAGDTLDIEGLKYVVLEEQEKGQALVMTASSIGKKVFNSINNPNYKGSTIDNYLENEWYNSLSSTKKAAIQPTNIKQASYAINDPDFKQETEDNDISRHVFLPSVSEIGKVVDLKNSDKVKAFLNGTSVWTRDRLQSGMPQVEYLSTSGGLNANPVDFSLGVRPTFVIDLSKVDYTVAGHTDSK